MDTMSEKMHSVLLYTYCFYLHCQNTKLYDIPVGVLMAVMVPLDEMEGEEYWISVTWKGSKGGGMGVGGVSIG